MQVSRWGNSLAIRVPAKLVRELGLKEGDEVELTSRSGRALQIEPKRDEKVERAMAEIKKIRVKMPDGWKFNREEMYEERMRELGW